MIKKMISRETKIASTLLEIRVTGDNIAVNV